MVAEVVPTDEELIAEAAIEAQGTSTERFAHRTAVMALGTTLSRITGMLRLTATAAAFGITTLSDTYAAANTTPNIVYELVLGGILTSIFVPVFVRWSATHGREASWEVAQRMLTLALVVLGTIALLAGIFAPSIMRLYLAGSPAAGKEAQVALGAFFLRWFMPQIVFYGIGAIAIGVLNANRRFAVVMFAPILNNVSVIVTMVAFIAVHEGGPSISSVGGTEPTLLAAGTTVGVVAMTLALWPSLRRIGFRWRWRLDLRHPAIRQLGQLARWTAVYVAANQLAYLLVIVLSNRAGAGAYFAYTQAFVFFQLPHAIFAVSVFTALMPEMAEGWATDRIEAVRALWSRGIRTTLVVMIPAALGYVVLAEPIVRLFAEYGAAGSGEGTDLMVRALTGFAVGLPFFSGFQLLTRTFYAMHDARTPALVNVAAASVNAAVNVLLSLVFGFGVGGLSLGHAVSYMFGAAMLGLIARRRLAGIDGLRISRTAAKVLPIGIAGAAGALVVSAVLSQTIGVASAAARLLQVFAAVLAGVLVFAIGALIFRLQEVDDLRSALARRLRR